MAWTKEQMMMAGLTPAMIAQQQQATQQFMGQHPYSSLLSQPLDPTAYMGGQLTPAGQAYGQARQGADNTNRQIYNLQMATPAGQWQTAHPQAFKGSGILDEMGNLPIVGDVVKGAQEVFGRPGDMFNNPMQFFGKAAVGAAPFLGGEIGPWAKMMGLGGRILQNPQAVMNPASALGLAGSLAGGDVGKGLGLAGKAYGIGSNFFNTPQTRTQGGQSGQNRSANMDVSAWNGGGTGQAWSDPSSGAQFGQGRTVPMNAMGGQQGRAFDFGSLLSGLGSAIGGSNTLPQLAGLYQLSGIGQPKYPDSGNMGNALGYADTLGQSGTNLLNQANQGLPSLNNMGALGGMQDVIGQQAQMSGVNNPFTGQGGSSNAYALQPYQQQQYNQQADMVNQGRQSALSNLRQQFAAQGITDPRAIATAEAQINAGHDQMLNQAQSGLATQAYGNRQNTLSQFSQELPNLYGQQFGQQQAGYRNAEQQLQSPINAYQNAARQAIDQNRYSQNQLGQMLGNMFPQQNPYMQMMQAMMGQGGGMGGLGQAAGSAAGSALGGMFGDSGTADQYNGVPWSGTGEDMGSMLDYGLGDFSGDQPMDLSNMDFSSFGF